MKDSPEKRNKWSGSPFPSLYDQKSQTPLCRRITPEDCNQKLILIHHINEVFEPFVNSISSGYEIEKIIGIPYSTVSSVVNRIREDFDLIIPDSLSQISHIVKDTINSSDGELIIQEIGGYTSDIIKFMKNSNRILGVVEDTNQGHWRWEMAQNESIPVLSIADSLIKRVEDRFVAMSIVDGTARYIEKKKLGKLTNKKVHVLGFGNLGQPICKYIQPLCKSLRVYDTDQIKSLLASTDYNVSADMAGADVILSVTGNSDHAVGPEDITNIDSQTLLLSGSSRRIEFDLKGFKEEANKVTEDGDSINYQFSGKDIIVGNNGEPVNLQYSFVPSKALDLVFAGLIHCTNMIASGYDRVGVNGISLPDQRYLAEEYMKEYEIVG
jgi:adenosylhomocysteinase